MKTFTKEALAEILEAHRKWLFNEDGGSRADLRYADLRSADLRYADLRYADLRSADLRSANLSSANLSYANLRHADLSSADLSSANLSSANLSSAKNAELAWAQTEIVPREGAVIGWKKCCDGRVVKLRIPAKARRSNSTGRKCRAEYAKVIAIWGRDGKPAPEAMSQHNESVIYKVGATVRCHEWDEDRWNECSGGIHFFLTREEAEAWEL